MKRLSKACRMQSRVAAAETGAVARTRGVPETSSQEFYSQKSVRGVWGVRSAALGYGKAPLYVVARLEK